MTNIHLLERKNDVALVQIKNTPDTPALAFRVFSALAEGGVSVDMILGTASGDRAMPIAFTVSEEQTEVAESVLRNFFSYSPSTSVEVDRGVVKLSVSGDGMQADPRVTAGVFSCLWDAEVKIAAVSRSEVKLCLLIPSEDGDLAYKALADKFI